jgi:hypothetical protein
MNESDVLIRQLAQFISGFSQAVTVSSRKLSRPLSIITFYGLPSRFYFKFMKDL